MSLILQVSRLPTETTQLMAVVVPLVTGPLRDAALAAAETQVCVWRVWGVFLLHIPDHPPDTTFSFNVLIFRARMPMLS